MGKPMTRYSIYGVELTVSDLQDIVHLSKTAIKYQMSRCGSAEEWALKQGILDATDLKYAVAASRISKLRMEDLISLCARKEKRIDTDDQQERMGYCERLMALGFEPFPSDYEREKRGEVV